MNKILIFLISLLFFCNSNAIAQDNGWTQANIPQRKQIICKQDGNIMYLVDSTTYMPDRDEVIRRTKEYISQNLDMINESDFDEPLLIDLGREIDYIGRKIWGSFSLKNEDVPYNMISSIYGPLRSSLKSELMQLIVRCKWGEQRDEKLMWLTEGLATYANPSTFSYDGHNFEERYTYFMQNGRLLSTDTIMSFSVEEVMPENKIAYSQAAYIVEYLIKNYGIDKVKKLWIDGMNSFVMIYGNTFEDFIVKINNEIKNKYPEPLDFNWEKFNSDCFASQHEEWLSLSPILYPRFENMVSKMEGNIRYTIDPTRDIAERDYIIKKTKKDIVDNLEIIGSPEFNDFIHIVILEDTVGMKKYVGTSGGTTIISDGMNREYFKEHYIFCIYKGDFFPLKHELMHAITLLQWGYAFDNIEWLQEGIASFADPEAFSCDGHTYEERYVYFLQNNKLLDIDNLKTFPDSSLSEKFINKIAYNQSAYLIEYLLKNYDPEKFKSLWKNGMNDFERIYKLTFDELTVKIKTELEKKYPKPIDFNEEGFNKSCYKEN